MLSINVYCSCCQRRRWMTHLSTPVVAGSGRHLEGENMEFWNLAGSGELAFALQTVSDGLTPLTVPQFWETTPLNCQCSTAPHKEVCTPSNIHCWSDWNFTCCKTVEDPYCPVTVLVAITIQWFALFTCFIFCIKYVNFAWYLVNWSWGKSLHLLPPDVRFQV